MASPFLQAQHDAIRAVTTFIPSLGGKQPQAPPSDAKVHPSHGMTGLAEAGRALSIANHVEFGARRMARGLPAYPPPPPTPEQQFGNELDPVHIRALQEALANVPEEHRGRLLSELHDSIVRWIGSHNGKVVVDGKIQMAATPTQAEGLATRLVNSAVDSHDKRVAQSVQPEAPSAGRDITPNTNGTATSGGQPISPMSSGPSGTARPQIAAPENGEQITPLGPPRPVSPKEAARVGARDRSDRPIMQPRKGVESNRKLALEAAPDLEQTLSDLVQGVPGAQFVRMRPQKAEARIGQKTDDKDPQNISDYLGAQISVDSPQAKEEVLARLKKLGTIEIDDQFENGRPEKAGFASTHVQIRMKNGMTSEVQIVPKEVLDANEQSHPFYHAGVEAEAKGDDEERDRQWAQASAINQDALARFKQRNAASVSAPSLGISDAPPSAGAPTVTVPLDPAVSPLAEPSSIESPGDNQASPPPAPAPPNPLVASGPAPVSASSPPSLDHGSRIRQALQNAGYEATGEPINLGGKMFVGIHAPADNPQQAEPNPRSPDTTVTPRQFSKGDRVKLGDGTEGEVRYAGVASPTVRVKTARGYVEAKPGELQAIEDEGNG